jgi:hypothetical protein
VTEPEPCCDRNVCNGRPSEDDDTVEIPAFCGDCAIQEKCCRECS